MNRRRLVTRILTIDGILLLLVATLYFVLINSAVSWLEERISPLEKFEVMPLFLMNHIAVGLLLIPLALSTFYCAWGVKKGQQWSRVISLINGISLLALPIVLSMFMGAQYYGSFLFLLTSVLIVLVGITMLVPLFWFPKDGIEGPTQGKAEQKNG